MEWTGFSCNQKFGVDVQTVTFDVQSSCLKTMNFIVITPDKQITYMFISVKSTVEKMIVLYSAYLKFNAWRYQGNQQLKKTLKEIEKID